MNMLLCILIFVAWWYVGYRGFVYWWTADFDYTTDQRITAWAAGLIGPLSWALGCVIHGGINNRDFRVIKEKKK